MSICRCKIHDKKWDSDFLECCPGCEGHLVSLKNLEHQFSSFIQSCKSYLPEDDNEKVYKYLENRLFDIREEIKELREDMYS